MSERTVDLSSIITYGTWAVAWLGILASVLLHEQRIAWLSIALIAVAAVVDVRTTVARHHRMTRRTLELQREADRHLSGVPSPRVPSSRQ